MAPKKDPYAILKAYGNQPNIGQIDPSWVIDQSAPRPSKAYTAGETAPAGAVPLPPVKPAKITKVTLPSVGAIDVPEKQQPQQKPQQPQQPQQQEYATATTSSTSTQTRSGRPIDKPWLAKRGELLQSQREVGQTEAEIQARMAEQSEAAMASALERMGARSAQLAKEKARIQEQIQAREDRIDAATKEVARAKVDPEHYWNNISTGDKVMHGMAIALGGFLKGWTQGKMQNSALQMYNQAVERDLQAQRRKILQKKEGIKGDENMLAHYYRDLGSLAEAETAYRNTQNAHMRLQLKKIQASGAPALVKANARRVELGLEAQLAQEQHQERIASFEQTVTTRNVQTRKIPLTSGVMGGATAAPQPPPDKVLEDIKNINIARSELDSLAKDIKKHGGFTGLTAWTGGAADRINQKKERVIDRVLMPLIGKGASNATIMRMKEHLGGSWTSGSNSIKKIKEVLHMLDNEAAGILRTNSLKYDMRPMIPQEKKRRLRQRALYGMRSEKLQVQAPIYRQKTTRK